MTDQTSSDEWYGSAAWEQAEGMLRLEPEREATDGALFLEEVLRHVSTSHYYWRWSTIALYNLSYAACVLALRGTWPVLLLNTEQMKKSLRNQHLTQFDEAVWSGNSAALRTLYLRVQNDSMMHRYVFSKSLPPNADQALAMDWMIQHRDMFTHFKAETLIEDVQPYPKAFLQVLEVVRFLVQESGNVRPFDDEFHTPLRNTLKRIEVLLQP